MKLKYLISSIVLLLLTYTSSFALNNINGTVYDSTNNITLTDATIFINELKLSVNTNIDGNYEIKNLKNGRYTFTVSYYGYNNIIFTADIHNDTTINFMMQPAIAELDKVVVTATTHNTEVKRSPVIIQPISKATLNQNSGTNIVDALKTVPGVDEITTGAGISKPTIRGLGYNRVVTLFDGIRQEGQQWGDEHGVEIDEFAIDNVEVIKGPGSLMYGSDAIAGVLNFISPKPLPQGDNHTQLISEYQSNNQLIANSLSNAGNKNGIQWLGRITNKYAGNFQNKYDGKVYNSGFNEWDASAFVGITKSWGYSHLNISSFNTTLAMPEGERDSTGHFTYEIPYGNDSTQMITTTPSDLKGYKIGMPHQKVNNIRVISNNYFILSKGTINLDLGYQNNKRREFDDVWNTTSPGLYFNLNTLNYNLRYNFATSHHWERSIGISGMYQANENKGSEYLIPNYQTFNIGAFAFAQKTIGKFIIAAGFRYDFNNIKSDKLLLNNNNQPVATEDSNTIQKFASSNQNYHSVSGSVGLTYLPNDKNTFKFNLSQGFRTPNIAELASNGVHEGTFKYEYGNTNLKSEISRQIDIAYYYTGKHFTFQLTPFINFIDNYIYSRKLESYTGSDSIPDTNNAVPAFQYTQGNAVLTGGEVYFDVHPHPLDWLHIENSFAFVQATQLYQPDSTKYLPFIPAPKYRGVIRAQFPTIGKSLGNVYVQFAVEHYFNQNRYYKAYNTETATPGYTLLNVGFGGNIKMFGKKDFASLYFNIDNLANIAYQSHLNRLKYAPINPLTDREGIYNMGRNISLKLILNI